MLITMVKKTCEVLNIVTSLFTGKHTCISYYEGRGDGRRGCSGVLLSSIGKNSIK